MDLLLNRLVDDGVATMGELIVPPFKFDTLELSWRNNTPWGGDPSKVSCIPAGRYRMVLNPLPPWSHLYEDFHDEFPVLPLLQDVPGRSGIYCHPLNKAADSHGCFGIGMTGGKDVIGQSRDALKILLPFLEKKITLDPDGLWLVIANRFNATAISPAA